MPFAIYSGNGQVVGRNYGSPEKLRVRLTDGGGNPVVGQAVTWALASGVGYPTPASGVTDADGIAETTYLGGDASSVTAVEKYKTSVVRASTLGEPDVDFYATTINNPMLSTGGVVDAMPTAGLVDPIGSTHLIVGQAGQTLAGYVTVLVGFYTGATLTTPVPYVGLELSSTADPLVQATATGGPILSDASGVASLDVTFGAVVGGGSAVLKIGLTSYVQAELCYWNMFLLARTLALPQIEYYDLPTAGMVGTQLLSSSAVPGTPPIRVRVRDGSGIPANGVAVLWESVTAGAMEFTDSELVTDADGFASTGVLLGLNPGMFNLKVTSMGVELLLGIEIVSTSGGGTGPTGETPTYPGVPPDRSGGGGSSAIVRTGGTDRSNSKRASIAISEITTEDMNPENLVFKLNQTLRLLADQLARVQGNNGPFRFGEGALTLNGDTQANQNFRVQKTLRLKGESDRAGNVIPLEFLDDLPTYADNATAIAYGLTKGKIYMTATGQLSVVY